MFRGRYEHQLDVKGRLALPAAFKKTLLDAGESNLVVTPHISSPCLVAYPTAEWEAFEKRIAKLPQFDPSVMMLRRLYVGGAMDCAIDRQGRVLIPQILRDHAAIQREAFWVGGMRTLEIWSKTNWETLVEHARPDVGPDVLAKLGELGL
ncbi:MAG: division/cell wall cluster transcriptional repressor MraZ [Deltaproteobacteria bacterium]|nr:division/cell wall cluster transcriptional repressor MraZ [Deltaproteobacteria bacterium]